LSINYPNLEIINQDLLPHKQTQLLIVSKNQAIEDIRKLLLNGYLLFGENRVQEAKQKFTRKLLDEFPNLNLHLIGPLQSNKTKLALSIFHCIQSLDRKKLIDAIVREKKNQDLILTKEFYIQINIGNEEQKAGVLPNDLFDLYEYSIKFNLNITGLMCIPPQVANPEIFFEEMENLKQKINKNLKLSMGMSGDYKIALKSNSNLIRIGSKIFK
tara:strand:+ start:210 stop:851 length:642 start_codon:yes stop_codon:yes gene_type:complete